MKPSINIFKIGGNIINNAEALHDFLTHFAQFTGVKILVHGGGVKASEVLAQMGITPKMVGGRRITDAPSLEVITMVYGGLLNKNIVAGLQARGCNALGLSGADGNTIIAHKRPVKAIDYGFAGDVDYTNPKTIKHLVAGGLTPVFCALTHDQKGQILNTNADTIAASIATGLAKDHEVALWYLFEKQGVMRNRNDENSVIEQIDHQEYQRLKAADIIAAGMIPKMENCFNALQAGVAKVKIAHANALKDPKQTHTTLSL